MSKEYAIGFCVGVVLVLGPLFAFGWVENDWLGGARISMSVGLLASALESAALLVRATRRLLTNRNHQQKGGSDVL